MSIRTHRRTDFTAARSLGYASIAIGLVELLLPHLIQRALGVRQRHTGLVRLMGVRELLQSLPILARRDPTPGVWGRVAGDALDGLLLAAAAKSTRNPKGFSAILALVLPIVIADLLVAKRLSSR